MSKNDSRMARRMRRRQTDEDIDPMNYVSNLSDVMLILAVGIMLALILHWKVPVGDEKAQAQGTDKKESVTFSDDDLAEEKEMPDDAEQVGQVYYDPETKTYYIVMGE